ncbi:hypothetical protein T459_08829 [Capsicum annuum]|uniref:Uncharacterized protein n=1 Tax=Capsicum annuum TaxID=4072 RepID=A0A2G2ZXK8_CAPAN|nr:hypothetical protein T459_08829 [Capsicum annuum]
MDLLRNVKITRAEFDLEEDKQMIFKESSKLENLRILRGVDFQVDQTDSVAVLLGRCPNLEELDIRFKDNEGSTEICPKLESISQLQIFRLSFQCPQIVSGLHLSSNLKKLELSRIRIGSMISYIAGLPSLEYLKLSELYFIQSEEWCHGDITFHNLKFLKLAFLFISRWDASEESFPLLETLAIRECHKLEEISRSFADIPTLKKIKLINCKNESLEASAVNIKQEVTDIEGCDRIDIIIGIPLFKFLADNVGRFCLPISLNEDGADTFNIKSKPPYLLFLVVLVELEMKNIFLCELKASKFIQSRTFKDKKLPKGFLHHLHRLLVYLRNKNLDNLPANVSARKFDVAIEFLLVFLSDVPNHVISEMRLNEVLAQIGVLVGGHTLGNSNAASCR